MNRGFTLIETLISLSLTLLVIFPFFMMVISLRDLTLYNKDRVEVLQNLRIANELIRQDFQGMKLSTIGSGRMGGFWGIWGKNSQQEVIGYYLIPKQNNMYRYIVVPINKSNVKDSEFPDRFPGKFRQPTSNPVVQNVGSFSYQKQATIVVLELKLQIKRIQTNIRMVCHPKL